MSLAKPTPLIRSFPTKDGSGPKLRRWLPVLTVSLALIMTAGLVAQARAMLACFQLSDELGDLLHRSRDDERVLMLGERLVAAVRLGGLAPEAVANDTSSILALARQLQTDSADLALLASASDRLHADGLQALRKAAARDSVLARAAADVALDKIISLRSWVYRSVLFDYNCMIVMAALAIVLSLLYCNERLAGWRRLVRAQRTVLDAQRRQAGFLTAAGHDLRQPLGALTLFVSSLQPDRLDAQTRATLGKIGAAAASMERMLTSLLDVAKLDAGLVSADLQQVQTYRLFQSLRAEFEALATERGITFVVQDDDAVVVTDPDMLERILRNLIGNAVKYIRAGEIAIRAERVGGRVVVSVADTGPGMDPARLKSIFQDFVRLRNTNSDGLGLGLGIVRRLAELLGTEVKVESSVEKGSVFSLELPAVDGASRGRPWTAP